MLLPLDSVAKDIVFGLLDPLPSNKQYLSSGAYLEDKREDK